MAISVVSGIQASLAIFGSLTPAGPSWPLRWLFGAKRLLTRESARTTCRFGLLDGQKSWNTANMLHSLFWMQGTPVRAAGRLQGLVSSTWDHFLVFWYVLVWFR